MPETLAPWLWLPFGVALVVLGSWRDWGAARALGIGAAFAGIAAWAMGEQRLGQQLVLWAGLSVLSWIGGRRQRMRRAAEAGPEAAGRHQLGRKGTAVADFRNGHGRVRIGDAEFDATADDDLAAGAAVRVVSYDDESVKVAAARPTGETNG